MEKDFLQARYPSCGQATALKLRREKFNEICFCVKVLSVDVVNSKLLLTHKKSLVNSKMAAITSYADLRTGVIIEGCVVSITPTGLVVTFYNNVKVIYL